MTWRTRRAAGRGAWWAAAAVGAVCVGACSRPVPLVPGEEVEGELAPEGQVTYGLRLAENDYARVRVVPAVTDRMGEVSAVVSAPDDRPIIEAIGIRNEAGSVLAWDAPEEGVYRLRLSNSDSILPLPYRLEAEEVRLAGPEDRHRATAESTAAEAARLLSRGEREKAVEAQTRALESWRRVGDTGLVADALLDLADLEFPLNPEGALIRCDEALSLSVDDRSRSIEALKRKGRLLGTRNDCAGALAAFEEAKRMALMAGDADPAEVGSAIYEIGSLQKQCRSYDLAESALEQSLEYGRRAGDGSLQAESLCELAMMAKWRGDLSMANERITAAVRLAEASGDREVLAAVLHEYANIEKAGGRLIEAREHYQRCLEINESLAELEPVIPTLLTLGILSLDLRRSEEARSYFERALQLAEDLEETSWIADAERELGAAYERLRMFDRAEAFYRRSLATAEKIGRQNSIATAYFRLGNLLVLRERFGEAIAPLSAALEQQRSLNDWRELPLTLRVLGRSYWRLGDRDRALQYLSEALSLQRQQSDSLRTAWTLHWMALVQAEQDPAAARRMIEEAIDISRKVRSGLRVDELRVDFFEAPRSLYDTYVDLLLQDGDVPAAFAANEEGRAQALLDLLVEARVDPRAEIDPQLVHEARELDRRIQRSQRELRSAHAGGSVSTRIEDQLERDQRAMQRLEATIRRQSRRYRELSAFAVRTLREVQASLPPSRVLLEYWLGTQQSYVFVVTHDEAVALPLPRERDLSARIERFRDAIVRALPPSTFAAEAYSLYQELVAPALEIAPRATELIVVPDGRLNLVPFEALVTEPPTPGSGFDEFAYLIREMETSYAPSATVLANLGSSSRDKQRNDGGGPSFVAFADPDAGPSMPACPVPTEDSASGENSLASGGPELPRLRGGRQEVRRIARRYGRSARVYVGGEATEQRVVSDPEVATARRLHFAVHGIVCESRPERSGLMLALDESAAEDGVLEMNEIFDLRLAADLVVLSACDTGVGRLVRGEGVVGLSRAFFYAGVPSLVVSLWPVADQSTASLMTSFYAELDRGEDKAEALRRAKLGFLDGGGSKSAPLYWAPFILVGSRGGAEQPDDV